MSYFLRARIFNLAGTKSFPMSDKKVIIIGGGMAGVVAGTYLRMNDYDTTIYEMKT